MKKAGILLLAALFSILCCAFAPAYGEERNVALESAQTQVITGDVFRARIYAPDADEVILYCSDSEEKDAVLDRWIGGVNADITLSYDSVDSVTLRLSARFGSDWVNAGPIQFRVTAPYGEMPEPVLRTQSPYRRGEDVSFTLETVKGAVMYSMAVLDAAAGRPQLWGIAEPLNLTPETLRFFPELRHLPEGLVLPNGKRVLAADAIYPDAYRHEPGHLAALCLIRIGGDAPDLRPMPLAEMFGHLVHAHTFAQGQRQHPAAAAACAAALEAAPCFMLQTGPDPLALGPWLVDALSAL